MAHGRPGSSGGSGRLSSRVIAMHLFDRASQHAALARPELVPYKFLFDTTQRVATGATTTGLSRIRQGRRCANSAPRRH